MRLLRLLLAVAALAVLAAAVVPRLDVRLDLSFFLPDDPPPRARLLVDRLREGAGGGTVMIGITGAEPARLAEASDAVAEALRESDLFAVVANGRPSAAERAVLEDLTAYRYLLADTDFSTDALRAALKQRLAELSTSRGWAFRELLPQDPTGTVARLAAEAQAEGPARRDGVWMNPAGDTALLLARSHAGAADLAAQAQVAATLDAAAAPWRAQGLAVTASGPGLLSLETSRLIRAEAQVLSVAGSVVVAVLLLVAFRSLPMLVILGLPLATAVLAGAAVVQGLFGHIHGVALTFGATLIGVAVDYPLHLATHVTRQETPRQAVRRLARPLLLSALTTIGGFLALAQSGFPGLAQLGTFAAVGLAAALLLTRFVMPLLLPPGIGERGGAGWERRLAVVPRLQRLRPWALALLALVIGVAVVRPGPLWEEDLSRLGALPQAAKDTDRTLRHALRAPDAQLMLVVRGETAEAVLQRQEALAPALADLQARGAIGGSTMAADLLPSLATQRARQQALPKPTALRAALDAAVVGLPFKPETFAPFVAAVARQRDLAPLTPATVPDGPLRWRLEPLLKQEHGGWTGLVLLRGPVDAAQVAALAAAPQVLFLDLKAQATALMADYRDEALRWLGIGLGVGLLVMLGGLRSVRATAAAALPPALAVAGVVAALVAAGVPLTLFHVLALLLVASIGVDYALFFAGYSSATGEGGRTLRAIVLCNGTTVAVFATLAFSSMPVLSAIGITVALGAALSLLMTIVFAAVPKRLPD